MKRFLLIPLTLLALACSCSNEITPSISLSQTTTTFPYTGGTVKTSVTCNCDWEATCDSTQTVMISPTSHSGDGIVSITVPPTTEKVTTPVRITFTATSGSSTSTAKFVVTQLGKPYIEIPQAASTIYMPAEESGIRLNIESNGEWEYVYSSANKNLTISPASGTYNDVVAVAFPASALTRNKTYNLTFCLKDDTSTKVTVKFIQYGKK